MSTVLTKTTGPLVRSYLRGRTSADTVKQEREQVISMLIVRGLYKAANAMRCTRNSNFQEFFEIRRVMLSGGPRLMRLHNGRRIERR